MPLNGESMDGKTIMNYETTLEYKTAYKIHTTIFDESKHCYFEDCESCKVITKILGVPEDTTIAFEVASDKPLIPGISDADAACVVFDGQDLFVTMLRATENDSRTQVLFAILKFDLENLEFNLQQHGIVNDDKFYHAIIGGHLLGLI